MATPFRLFFYVLGISSMKARSGFWISVVGLTLVAASIAVAAETTTTTAALEPTASDPALAIKGRTLYATNCVHCHGVNMVTPGTVAFDLREFPHDDHARFVHSVTNGKNNRMPPWGDILKPDEIDALWAYVLTGGKL
ncbi:MAG: cytochrome c [Xanthobacteraceae bacterium]|nr:cytochrome c [Xanthobacteraceae bacterium]